MDTALSGVHYHLVTRVNGLNSTAIDGGLDADLFAIGGVRILHNKAIMREMDDRIAFDSVAGQGFAFSGDGIGCIAHLG